MATKREPWDDDSDSDFQSAASFELDDSEDEARGGRVRDDDDEFVLEHEAFADEDFHECVDGLLLDEGYFGEDAYRGPPGAWADDGPSRPTSVPADRIAEADLERAAMARESEMDDANAKKKSFLASRPCRRRWSATPCPAPRRTPCSEVSPLQTKTRKTLFRRAMTMRLERFVA